MSEIKTPCPACGSGGQEVQQLGINEFPTFFVRCGNCDSVCTVTHAIREEAIKKWENLWCWDELEKAKKRILELEEKEKKDTNALTDDQRTLKFRLETLLEHYIKFRLDYSGSWGNLSQADRRKVLIRELAAELGWDV